MSNRIGESIAIDGSVSSGKTTVGRLLARRLGFAFLDTGMMYRAATWSALRRGLDLEDARALTDMAESLDISLRQTEEGERLIVDGFDATDELRTPLIDRNVSAVSAVEGVRRALVPRQRAIAERSPVVMVGQDIGTVVLFDAPTKIYLDAPLKVRAARRHAELAQRGVNISACRVMEDMERRDALDSGRRASPREIAEDALVVGTGELSAEEVVERIIEYKNGRG